MLTEHKTELPKEIPEEYVLALNAIANDFGFDTFIDFARACVEEDDKRKCKGEVHDFRSCR